MPNDYDDYMEVVADHSAGRFLPVCFDHSRYLKGDGNAANVLAFVLNLLKMKWASQIEREQLQRDGMWIRCPAGEIQSQLGMSGERQQGAVDRLVKKELLETDHRKGNILWVRVNTEELKKVGGQKPGKPETGKTGNRNREDRELETGKTGNLYSSNNLPNNPSNTPPPTAAAENGHFGLSSGKEAGGRSSAGGRLARRLQEGLVRQAKVDVLGTEGWARHFNRLVEKLANSSGASQEVAADKVAALIDDHVANYRDQFQPKANTAEKFCKRYTDITEARERRGRPRRPEDDPDFLGMAPPGFDTPEYQAEQAAEMDRLAEERRREAKRAGRVVRIVRVDDERSRP